MKKKEIKRVRVFISGLVQGVFFRSFTQKKAQELGLAGWVRNLKDGRVESVFEGEKDKIDKMIKWCYQGPPNSKVEKVEKVEEAEKGLKSFEINY